MKQTAISSWLSDLEAMISSSSLFQMSCFRQVIIAGSYADWLKNQSGVSSPSWKAIPDINIYVLVDATPAEEIDAMTALGNIYRDIAKTHKDISLLLDLHPFSISVGTVVPFQTLQVTSRVLNINGCFPDYCWFGWKSNYIHLLGTDILASMEISHPKRDILWLKHMHMAFSSYSNVMYMIALSSMKTDSLVRFDESYRYLKEVIKDGISLGLPISDYPEFDYSVIKEWKDKTDNFYMKFYGPEEASIVKHVLEIEQNYFEYRTDENADVLQREFCTLHAAVYEKGFKARCSELCNNVNEFTEIPKWY